MLNTCLRVRVMNKNIKGENRLLLSVLPAPLLLIVYVIADIAFSSMGADTLRMIRIVLLIGGLIALFVAIAGIWRVRGWYKLLAVCGAFLNVVLIAWLYFTLTFVVTF